VVKHVLLDRKTWLSSDLDHSANAAHPGLG
jgi:hypothetical protein